MRGILLFLFIICILLAPQIYTEIQRHEELQRIADQQAKFDRQLDMQLDQQSSEAASKLENTIRQPGTQNGFVRVAGVKPVFTEKKLQQLLRRNTRESLQYNYTWSWQGQPSATASAPGLDRQHHFVNSYLVGFKPFDTDHLWVPLYTLSKRKLYEYDHIQYSSFNEVWQNSQQAFYYTRGDCEDHALILADWLIGLGEDARVVVGKHRNIGHAWVVLFKDGKEYLLEATSKQRYRNLNGHKLAALETDYKPKFQFNRDSFWFNTGSEHTTRYSGDEWKFRSRFYLSTLHNRS